MLTFSDQPFDGLVHTGHILFSTSCFLEDMFVYTVYNDVFEKVPVLFYCVR